MKYKLRQFRMRLVTNDEPTAIETRNRIIEHKKMAD